MALFDKQKVKNDIQKLVKRLADAKSISFEETPEEAKERIRKFRERNMFFK